MTISIHALRGESDRCIVHVVAQRVQFQSTLSVGRATLPILNVRRVYWSFQSTLSVGRATPPCHRRFGSSKISIHALRGESDDRCPAVGGQRVDFNPRSPWGERHFPAAADFAAVSNFNPRSPWGERREFLRVGENGELFQSTLSVGRATFSSAFICLYSFLFQSTLSVGRATPVAALAAGVVVISIHALRGESDLPPRCRCSPAGNFNPRSPWGERPQGHLAARRLEHISIHALRGESDSCRRWSRLL